MHLGLRKLHFCTGYSHSSNGGLLSMKIRYFLILALFCFSLTGCLLDPSEPYSFYQSENQITCIDILQQNSSYTSWEDRFVLCRTLQPDEHTALLSDLLSVTGQPFWSPPSSSFGNYVIRITYFDGSEEYISSSNNGYLTVDKKFIYDTYRFTDFDGFNKLISKYLLKTN